MKILLPCCSMVKPRPLSAGFHHHPVLGVMHSPTAQIGSSAPIVGGSERACPARSLVPRLVLAMPVLTMGLDGAGVSAVMAEAAIAVTDVSSTPLAKPGETEPTAVENVECAPSGKLLQPEAGKGWPPFHQ